jgi:hypothetical protein
MTTAQCPSLAHGLFPTTTVELFSRGPKNFETDSLPKSVNLSYETLAFGSGFPITSREFRIA